MRKATLIVTAVIAALALSLGAFAYPVVVGTHPLSTVHPNVPATVAHPKGDDNSTGNQTNDNETGDSPTSPPTNETENETAENETGDNETAPVPPTPESNETELGNVSVEHNVTETRDGNTTWINGTVIVDQGNQTLLTVSFQIAVHDNGTANVTLSGDGVIGATDISVRGVAVFASDRGTLDVFGITTATQNGTVLWQRPFGFELPSGESGPA